jgi:hypothetical protein
VFRLPEKLVARLDNKPQQHSGPLPVAVELHLPGPDAPRALKTTTLEARSNEKTT